MISYSSLHATINQLGPSSRSFGHGSEFAQDSYADRHASSNAGAWCARPCQPCAVRRKLCIFVHSGALKRDGWIYVEPGQQHRQSNQRSVSAGSTGNARSHAHTVLQGVSSLP